MSYSQTEEAVYLYGPQVTIPYDPVTDLVAGQVVDLGTFVGVALEPIDNDGDPAGCLCIQGVFSFLKETGSQITVGSMVLWDDTNNVAYVSGGGYSDDAAIGPCVEAATSSAPTVKVYLNPFHVAATG